MRLGSQVPPTLRRNRRLFQELSNHACLTATATITCSSRHTQPLQEILWALPLYWLEGQESTPSSSYAWERKCKPLDHKYCWPPPLVPSLIYLVIFSHRFWGGMIGKAAEKAWPPFEKPWGCIWTWLSLDTVMGWTVWPPKLICWSPNP